jgi:hypothetical protein
MVVSVAATQFFQCSVKAVIDNMYILVKLYLPKIDRRLDFECVRVRRRWLSFADPWVDYCRHVVHS